MTVILLSSMEHPSIMLSVVNRGGAPLGGRWKVLGRPDPRVDLLAHGMERVGEIHRDGGDDVRHGSLYSSRGNGGSACHQMPRVISLLSSLRTARAKQGWGNLGFFPVIMEFFFSRILSEFSFWHQIFQNFHFPRLFGLTKRLEKADHPENE